MAFEALADRLARVREEIATIQSREGLELDLRIVGVTKGHPPAAVRAAVTAGLMDVGENRIQEAVAKQDELGPTGARWHLIGHLQTNKAKHVPGRFALVHSVDSPRVAAAIAKAVAASGAVRPLPVLVQVNVADEAQKSGCEPAALGDLLGAITAHPELVAEGLMTMAPFTDDVRVQHRVFRQLRELRERHRGPGCPLRELSMGMTGDYPAAVAEGATIVRLGTVLFGDRLQ